jgi:hypothetical protein
MNKIDIDILKERIEDSDLSNDSKMKIKTLISENNEIKEKFTIDKNKIVEDISEIKDRFNSYRIEMSVGELIRLYEDKEMYIPEIDEDTDIIQKSKTIENLIIGLPTEKLFIRQDKKGNWKLLNKQNEMFTIIEYFGKRPYPEWNNFKLQGLKLVKTLNGCESSDLPIKERYEIKKQIISVEIITINENEIKEIGGYIEKIIGER